MSVVKGDLSKARRILRQLDLLLDILRDETVFTTVIYKQIEPLENYLLKARLCVANIMARFGYNSGYPTTPLPRPSKDNEHGNTFVEKQDDGVSEKGSSNN